MANAREANHSELTLRPFAETDDAEVTSWFEDAGELRFFAGRRLHWPLDSAQWQSIREDPKVTAWTGVIGEDQSPVAHAELVRETSERVRLARLAVAPALRGRGFGRETMSLIVSKCLESGFELVTLAVHRDNTTAIRSYRTFGFLPGEAPDSSGRLLMELALPSAAR